MVWREPSGPNGERNPDCSPPGAVLDKAVMKLPIVIHPDPRLKKQCAPVTDSSDALRKLGRDMLETMYAAPGIGLAGPQVSELCQIISLDCNKSEEQEPRPLVMLNPRIVAASDELNTYEEGCLSIPDQYADVTRPAEVEVEWLDLDGRLQREGFGGLWATCVQHEIDHLAGKLFIDYLGPMRRQMITRKMLKLKKERARAS